MISYVSSTHTPKLDGDLVHGAEGCHVGDDGDDGGDAAEAADS